MRHGCTDPAVVRKQGGSRRTCVAFGGVLGDGRGGLQRGRARQERAQEGAQDRAAGEDFAVTCVFRGGILRERRWLEHNESRRGPATPEDRARQESEKPPATGAEVPDRGEQPRSGL
ncbi:hypothetical protein GCM10026982_60420 [Nocardiopsis aegyptia]